MTHTAPPAPNRNPFLPHIPFRARRIVAPRITAATAAALASIALFATPAAADPSAPANDHVAQAQTITLDADGNAPTVTGDTSAATREAGEPRIRNEISGSVWYRITSPVDRPLVLDTCSSVDFDTMIGVYTGTSVDALELVTSNDDSECGGSRVDFVAEAGVTYAIQVDGYSNYHGTFALSTNAGFVAPELDLWFSGAVNPHVDRPTLGRGATQSRPFTRCTLDDGPALPCTLPYVVPNATSLSEGVHLIEAQHVLGPYSSPITPNAFFIDTTAPTVEIVDGTADGATVAPTAAAWSVTSSEGYPNLTCDLDSIETRCDWATPDGQTGTVSLPELCNGTHSFAARGTDVAGNRGPVSTTRTFTVAGGSPCTAPQFTLAPYVDEAGATEVELDARIVAPRAGVRQYVEYGTTTAYGSRSTPVGPGVADDDTEVTIDFLVPSTSYHARWILENAHGRAVSEDFTFTTDDASGPGAPVSITSASEITETSAVLTAATPSNWETSARFEYGSTAAYGSTTSTSWGAGPLTRRIDGLQPRTTYHYRLVATTRDTRAETVDGTFTTGPIDVPVVVPPAPIVHPVPGPPAGNPAGNPLTAQIQKDLRASLRKVKLTRKGLRKGTRIALKVKTRSAGVVRASAGLRRGKSKKAVTLGSTKKAVKRAGTVSIKLPVSKKAKREVKRKGKLTVTLKAQFTPGGSAKAITVTRKVTVK